MENKKVTYGTPTMMEYVAVIKLGKTTLRVPFSGGTITAYGVNPATYSTSNPIYQRAIENSEAYRSGRIVKMSETLLSGENKIKLERNPEKPASEPTAASDETFDETNGETTEETEPIEGESVSETAENEAAENETADETSDETINEDGTNLPLVEVEVTCLEDAATYLKENFGVANRQVRSKASAETIGKANGVKFVWV